MPSADHDATSSSGEPVVTQYNVEVYEVGASQPLQVSSIGKPAPGADGRIKVALSLTPSPVPNTVYVARVAALGPNGASPSDWSNTFSLDGGSSSTPVGSFTNGGFEADYLGWVASGTQMVVTAPWYGATVTEGSKGVVFNAGQQPASGVLSQTFTTTVGQTYTLAFDLGAVSYTNFNSQSMQVTVKGVNTLVSKTASVSAPGNGIQYATQTMSFVADSASTTLTFRDASATSEDIDLFLDNVRMTSAVSAPSISSHPQSTSVNAGGQASFSVTASGSGPLSYQWRLNGAAVSGATSSTYTISNVQSAQAGGYSVVVSNSGGSVTSNTATLTVTQTPTITAQPQSVTVTAGSSATFGVTATGSGTLSYQWKFNSQPIAGATSTSYTVANAQAANAGAYTVTVSNNAGSVTSSAATLTVQAPTAPKGFVNGGFEADYTGWTPSGSQQVVTAPWYGATVTEGSKAVVFGAGQQAASGALSQSFATTPGQTYAVAFDLGAVSYVNFDPQTIQLTATGVTTLLSKTASVAAPGNGIQYASQSMTFVADSATTTLAFRDVSATTMDVDLFLDNIRVDVQAAPAQPVGLVNGGFEADYASWTATGNQGVYANGTNGLTVKDGSKAVVFNSGQSTPNGVLSQTFNVTAGATYTLSFDLGAYSTTNKGTQKVKVTVQGKALVLSQTPSVSAQGKGARWATQTYTFVADSNMVTLTFQDVSGTSTNVDMLLDNVKATAR
jgi:Ig-like domain-containing protein/immunoglobulin I-set domain protein/uncharacterized protein DUF642